MRSLLFTGLALATLSALPAAAQAASALPIAPVSGTDAGIITVEGGCGPGGFRAANGYCYPRRPPPRFRRECPPGFHLTPYGCRRNFYPY